jgi:uncharacterized membrane protein YkvA (DUF1232 family)
MRLFGLIRSWAAQMLRELAVLELAAKQPETPWYVKALLCGVIAYAASPIDLIPDFIPILGYLDDLVILPAGIALAIFLIPPGVLAECRRQASGAGPRRGSGWSAAVFVLLLWSTAAAVLLWHSW